jgi:integrase
MALHLYRRHWKNGRCTGGHVPDSFSYEPDEFRPTWKKCVCPIYASGKLPDNPRFLRKNTGCTTWAAARAMAASWEQETPPPADPPPASPPPAARPAPAIPSSGAVRKTIDEAGDACLKEYETNGCAVATLRRYRTVIRQFKKFSHGVKGYVYLDEWTTNDVREFRVWWKGCGTRAHNTNIGVVKSFLEFCLQNRWITTNVARFRVFRSRAQAAASRRNQKAPFTDAELERMLAACEKYALDQPRRYRWKGEDLEDFILISCYTGLRISDVVTFHIDRLTPQGDVHFRAVKNGKWVDTWVPEWLAARIRQRAEKYGPMIFGKRLVTDPVTLTNPWRVRLNQLWKLCGPWDEKPTHHRFRHTFVRILLEKGMSVAKVAELLGDTEEVVRTCYSKWVPERQEQMRAALQAAFASKPKATGKVVVIHQQP